MSDDFAREVADACVRHLLQCRNPITNEGEHLAILIQQLLTARVPCSLQENLRSNDDV